MDDFIDLVSLSDEELKALIGTLTAEEHDVSRQRRILHGKIDILRAELVLRLQHHHLEGESIITVDDVSRLSEILAGKRGAADLGHGRPDKPPSGKD
jgi:hypothetical protein